MTIKAVDTFGFFFAWEKKNLEPTRQEFCLLEKDHGPCYANLPRYAYDKKQERCVEFSFGGCGGNQNNFETIEECEAACMSEFLLHFE